MPMRKGYRDEWERAGYGSDMGSAAVVPPPPGHLRRVYHLTSAGFGINDVALGRLKVARVADSNDPFELEALICLLREQPFLKRFKESYDNETGFLSFSANWTNPVLWGHYGDKHRGICLGFDVPTVLAKEVEYIAKRKLERIDWSKFSDNIDGLLREKLSRMKFADWEYENEYRFFVNLNNAITESGLYFYPFGDDLQLVEVILGPRCNLSIDAVQRLTQTRYPHAVTFQARKARQHFAIVPELS